MSLPITKVIGNAIPISTDYPGIPYTSEQSQVQGQLQGQKLSFEKSHEHKHCDKCHDKHDKCDKCKGECKDQCYRRPYYNPDLKNPFDVKQIDGRLFVSSTNNGKLLIMREDGKPVSSVDIYSSGRAVNPYGVVPNNREATLNLKEDGVVPTSTDKLFVPLTNPYGQLEASTAIVIEGTTGPQGYVPGISPDSTLPAISSDGNFRGAITARGKQDDLLSHINLIANFGVPITPGDNGIVAYDPKNFAPTTLPDFLIDPNFAIGNLYRAYTLSQSPHGKQKIYVVHNYADEDLNPIPGFGRVSLYDTNGGYLKSISDKHLSAPVGAVELVVKGRKIAVVANKGDGKLRLYDVKTTDYLGSVKRYDGKPLVIPGINSITEKIQPQYEGRDSHENEHKRTLLFTSYDPVKLYSYVGELKLDFGH